MGTLLHCKIKHTNACHSCVGGKNSQDPVHATCIGFLYQLKLRMAMSDSDKTATVHTATVKEVAEKTVTEQPAARSDTMCVT